VVLGLPLAHQIECQYEGLDLAGLGDHCYRLRPASSSPFIAFTATHCDHVLDEHKVLHTRYMQQNLDEWIGGGDMLAADTVLALMHPG
jgi:hypothetical protein